MNKALGLILALVPTLTFAAVGGTKSIELLKNPDGHKLIIKKEEAKWKIINFHRSAMPVS